MMLHRFRSTLHPEMLKRGNKGVSSESISIYPTMNNEKGSETQTRMHQPNTPPPPPSSSLSVQNLPPMTSKANCLEVRSRDMERYVGDGLLSLRLFGMFLTPRRTSLDLLVADASIVENPSAQLPGPISV